MVILSAVDSLTSLHLGTPHNFVWGLICPSMKHRASHTRAPAFSLFIFYFFFILAFWNTNGRLGWCPIHSNRFDSIQPVNLYLCNMTGREEFGAFGKVVSCNLPRKQNETPIIVLPTLSGLVGLGAGICLSWGKYHSTLELGLFAWVTPGIGIKVD